MVASYRLNAKNIFFTYSQCTNTREETYEHWNKFGAIVYAVISIENHQDGGTHLHGLVQFVTRIDIKDPNRLKINNFGCNAQTAKQLKACITYVKKDNNFIEWGESHNYERVDDLYKLAKESPDEETFFNKCRMNKEPYQYADRAWKKAQILEANTLLESSVILGQITFVQSLIPIPWPALKSLWIKGSSGIGKTTWAKWNAKKPCLWITHLDNLSELRPTHRSIIFDDMSFKHLPRESQIHLVDLENPRAIHIRYKTVTIPAGIEKIFVSNTEIFDTTDDAIMRRIEFIDLS